MDVMHVGQLAGWLGAPPQPDPDRLVGPDVVIDSRLATPGSLFVALPGERSDGHAFLGAAATNGATVALVTRPSPEPRLVELVVPDTSQALTTLARNRVRIAAADGLVVLGITGSSGKTSTKDVLAHVLETAGDTVSPVGSFNNEIGVPLTATQVTSATSFLISELGARGAGHISWLCDIVRPRVGIVLNVGSAHLGEFGSVHAIAAAKGELVESLPDNGWAVLNADDDLVAAMADRTTARVAWFSTRGRPDAGSTDIAVWATGVDADDIERYRFRLHVATQGSEAAGNVRLRTVGAHQVANALAAAAAAVAVGLHVHQVAEALSTSTPRSGMRMAVADSPTGVTIVNDAYNANPESMRAALAAVGGILARRRVEIPEARLFAVLGDMLELGPGAPGEHVEIGRAAATAGAGIVIALGEFADDIVSGAAGAGVDAVRVQSRGEAVAALAGAVAGDIVLVKASRGMALDVVADTLLRAPDAAEGAQR